MADWKASGGVAVLLPSGGGGTHCTARFRSTRPLHMAFVVDIVYAIDYVSKAITTRVEAQRNLPASAARAADSARAVADTLPAEPGS